MNGKIGIGIIGCGGRIRDLLKMLPGLGSDFEIVALCDPDRESVREYALLHHPDAVLYESYAGLLEDHHVDWVMIGSWNEFHAEQVIAAFEAGKHVFSEKPAAVSLEEHIRMYESWKRHGKRFLLGFTLRFSPHYRKIKELAGSGAIGKLVSIEFNETLEFCHGGYIMSGWRRRKEHAGPHVLEKCCHDFDIVNWIAEDRVSRTASFGGLNFFLSENRRYSEKGYASWLPPDAPDPFTSDKNIVDNQVAIMEFSGGLRATFHTNLNAGQPERRMYILGTEGSIRSDAITGELKMRRIASDGIEEDYSTGIKGMHGGGDPVLCAHFVDVLTGRAEPVIGLFEGTESAAVCLAVDQAHTEGRVVEMADTWRGIDQVFRSRDISP